MNILEELSINPNEVGDLQKRDIMKKINNIMPQLAEIRKESDNLGQLYERSIDPTHRGIIDQVLNKAQQELEVNNTFLHKVIENEKELQDREERTNNGNGGVVTYDFLDTKKNDLIKLKTAIIKDLEDLDFCQIGKIKKDKNKEMYFASFDKMWTWILGVFFNSPPSKYYWPEFKKKVFLKDKGQELRRRMIVYNYKGLTFSEVTDLVDIVNVHGKVVRDFFGESNSDLIQFLKVLKNILKFKEEDDNYEKLKENAVEEQDVQKVREETLKQLKNKLTLSSIKYDVLSEMNNFLNLVVREFSE